MTMPRRTPFPHTVLAAASTLTGDRASQIAEFALSLPLLVIFVVGIFDFSGAVTLKQKLTIAATVGARVAAADPSGDLANPPAAGPASVNDAFFIIDSYLVSQQINDCGLAAAKPTQSGTTLTWVSTANSCPGGTTLQLTINRGCVAPETNGTVDTVNTCVTIQYPYSWAFTGVAGLTGGRFTPSTSITTAATAFNQN